MNDKKNVFQSCGCMPLMETMVWGIEPIKDAKPDNDAGTIEMPGI